MFIVVKQFDRDGTFSAESGCVAHFEVCHPVIEIRGYHALLDTVLSRKGKPDITPDSRRCRVPASEVALGPDLLAPALCGIVSVLAPDCDAVFAGGEVITDGDCEGCVSAAMEEDRISVDVYSRIMVCCSEVQQGFPFGRNLFKFNFPCIPDDRMIGLIAYPALLRLVDERYVY